ncbi:hypothetical protein [Haloferula sp. A504]|uniref:hypothetical protein n=1 Tax=Haloferula sp. A504 TaxID=3373601 RepID=UPI0031C51EDD|nr:hypothetical protein [Verrucomicrobiaceae bacterium E54]
MRNDPKIHLDDLADKLASRKDLPRKRKAPSGPTAADRKTAIQVVTFLAILLILFVLGLIVLFVRR